MGTNSSFLMESPMFATSNTRVINLKIKIKKEEVGGKLFALFWSKNKFINF